MTFQSQDDSYDKLYKGMAQVGNNLNQVKDYYLHNYFYSLSAHHIFEFPIPIAVSQID